MQQLLCKKSDTKATMAQQVVNGVFCKVRDEMPKAGQVYMVENEPNVWGVKLGYSVAGRNKYRNLALQVEKNSKLSH
jgi:hypothetical protein